MRWIETQYRQLGEQGWGPWVDGPRKPDGTTELLIADGLELERTYQVRARITDDSTGTASDWRYYDQVTLDPATTESADADPATGKPENAPPPPGTPRIVCGEQLTWPPLPPDAPPVQYLIRHGTGALEAWDAMVDPVGGAVDGPPYPMCLIPQGDRTIALRAVDEVGRMSLPTYLRVNEGPYDAALPSTGRLENERGDPLDPITLWDGVRETGTLVVGTELWSQAYPAGDGGPAWVPDDATLAWLQDDASAAWPTLYYQLGYQRQGYITGPSNGSWDPFAEGAVLSLGPVLKGGVPFVPWQAQYRLHDAAAWGLDDKAPAWHPDDSTIPWHGVDDGSPAWGWTGDPAWTPDDEGPAWDQYAWKPWPRHLGHLGVTWLDLRLVAQGGKVQPKFTDLFLRESMVRRPGVDFPPLDSRLDMMYQAGQLRQGPLGFRPAAGTKAGEVWYATDTKQLFLWDGVQWVELANTSMIPAAVQERRSWRWYDQTFTAASGYDRHYLAGQVTGGGIGAGAAPITGMLYMEPFVAPRGGTLDLISFEVTAGQAGIAARLAIYEATSDVDLYPGALVVQVGPSAPLVAAGIVSFAINVTLDPKKLYYLALLIGPALVTTLTLRDIPSASMCPILGHPTPAGFTAWPGVAWGFPGTPFGPLPNPAPGAPFAVVLDGTFDLPAIGARFNA